MNKGIHFRGYLPHWDFAGALQAVTFRLKDSVPADVIKEWKRELIEIEDDKVREMELRRRIARYEDAGHGAALFRDPSRAIIMQEVLVACHPQRYKLIDWCIMPNHVHVMCKLAPGEPLGEVVRYWKGVAAREIHRQFGGDGSIWMPDYFDRLVRDTEHLHECRAYIRNNPVKAKLCDEPENWPFSSAGLDWNPERGLQSAPDSESQP